MVKVDPEASDSHYDGKSKASRQQQTTSREHQGHVKAKWCCRCLATTNFRNKDCTRKNCEIGVVLNVETWDYIARTELSLAMPSLIK